MRLEICYCNMYRYLQKTNADPKVEDLTNVRAC